MPNVTLIIPLILLVLAGVRPAACFAIERDMKEEETRINRRYDNFFQWRNERDERLEKSTRGRSDRRKVEQERIEKFEKAREALVKERKARKSDEPMHKAWEAKQKERQEEHELLRRRYVERRDLIEAYRKKGRKIPEMKEYDLDQYE